MFKNTRKKIIIGLMPIIVSMFVSGCDADREPILGESAQQTNPTPTVVAVTPVNNKTDVFYNIKHVTAEFSVPMDPATLTAASFTLSAGDSTVPITAESVDYANNVADFTLASDTNLSKDTLYTATISTQAKSADGVALASDYVWTFTTGTNPDVTPPTVLFTSPSNNDLNVSVTKSISATFSEAMKSSSITAASPATITVKKTSDSTNVDGDISYSVINKIASFNPTSDLAPNTNYTVVVTTAAQDLAGNAMSSEYTWTFTTQAASVPAPVLIPPTVVAVTPSNGETNVPYNVRHITAEFSAAMDGISLGATSFTLSKGDPAEEVTAVSIDYADKVVDFTIGANLSPNTLYTATITTEAKSAEGAALASDYVWTFTTGAIPDTTRPTVLITSPSNNDFNVSITKTITATFSEAMKSTSITAPGTFTVKETNSTSTNISGVVSYDVANKVASFNPTADLADNTDYTAIITTAAQDLAGNAMLNNYVWSFTTSQNIPPKVIAVTPENNETDVSTNIKHITAEFSVVMDNTTLSTTSFTLSKGDPAQQVTAVSVEYANRVADLTLASDANLSENTLYTATITTDAKDENGVALLSDYVWTFTTGINPDVLPPEVLSTSPLDGAIDVEITKIITATFSEPMKASSITAANTFTLMETNTSLNVDGNVSYSVINQIASFNPTLDLAPDTNYTASITTAAQDLAGNAMLQDHNWTFVTASEAQPPLVPLGRAATYGIAATVGVTNTATAPNTQIDGDVVLNPSATCNGVDILFADGPGFGLCGGSAPSINGEVITPLYPDAETAQPITDDLRAAYLSITPANMPGGTPIAAPTTLGAPIGDPLVEGDNLFYPGVYESITSILITGDLTLDAQGDPDATFVFQSASTVGSMPNTRILLAGGAKASNVYWQAGSDATLQTATQWNGNIFAYRDITMVTGASSCGRLFAGAFTDGLFVFDSNRVSVPGNLSSPATCQ